MIAKNLKNNPFLPGDIMNDSNRYAGRDRLIIQAHNYLKDFRNVFVTGQRGVGKSSFAIQVAHLLRKNKLAMKRFNIKTNSYENGAKIVNYICVGTENLEDIAENLLIEFSKILKKSYLKNNKKSKSLEFDLKFLKGKKSTEGNQLSPFFTKAFSDFLINAFNESSLLSEQGLFFLIDEIDQVIENINLAVFVKVVTENLRTAGIETVAFILVGISKALSIMKQQHPSSIRFLVPLQIPPMEQNELEEIMSRALCKTDVNFGQKIIESIFMLSRGFPDPVHLIGYELYYLSLENDNKATLGLLEDVLRMITTNLKREEFVEDLNSIPSSQAEKLLFAIAKIESEIVNIRIISRQLEIEEDQCLKLCKHLCDSGFLEQRGLGSFRFIDPLFRIYLNIVHVNHKISVERAKAFDNLVKMTRSVINPSSEQINKYESQMYKIILQNYKEHGHTGHGQSIGLNVLYNKP